MWQREKNLSAMWACEVRCVYNANPSTLVNHRRRKICENNQVWSNNKGGGALNGSPEPLWWVGWWSRPMKLANALLCSKSDEIGARIQPSGFAKRSLFLLPPPPLTFPPSQGPEPYPYEYHYSFVSVLSLFGTYKIRIRIPCYWMDGWLLDVYVNSFIVDGSIRIHIRLRHL